MFSTEEVICNRPKMVNSIYSSSKIEFTCEVIFRKLHIACSLLRFWIIMLIVCNNWSETVAALLIFKIRTNSPMICFSMKNLNTARSTQKFWNIINLPRKKEEEKEEASLEEGSIMLVTVCYQLWYWSQRLNNKILHPRL